MRAGFTGQNAIAAKSTSAPCGPLNMDPCAGSSDPAPFGGKRPRERNHGGDATLQRHPTREGGSVPVTIEHGDHPMSRVEYDGDNPLRLANEIEAALVKYGVGSDHRMCKAIHFFEGELRLIAECLRCAGPQKVAKQPRNSTRRVATR